MKPIHFGMLTRGWRAIGLGTGVVSLLLVLAAAPVGATSGSNIGPIIPDIPCCGGGGPAWGVDAVTIINSTFLSTIESHPGTPAIVGQYLDAGSGALLSSSDATYLHDQGIAIVLLFSPDNSVLAAQTDPTKTAAQVASSEAATAVSEAEAVGADADSDIAIYRDVEESYTISSAYVNDWYSDITADGYIAGFYENSDNGEFEGAFCGASATTISDTYLYASELHSGSSYKEVDAPTTYDPYYVSCESGAQMSGWQYLTGDSLTGGSIDSDEYAQVGLF